MWEALPTTVFKKKGGFFQMKKIITAVAAVAMATTMFAADVAANVRMNGSLFNLDGEGKVRMIGLDEQSNQDYRPQFKLAVSGDKAGASVCFVRDIEDDNTDMGKPGNAFADSEATKMTKAVSPSIWFAPVDMLKVTLGQTDRNINQETIDWCNSDTNIGGFGVKADLNIDAFNASVLLLPGEGNYYVNDGKIAQTAVFVGYNADFGNIGAMFDMEDKMMAFGLGYKGNAGSVSYFVNAMGYLNDGTFGNIRAEAFVSANIESVGINVFLPMNYVLKGAAASETCGNKWHKGGVGYSGNKDGQFILGTTAKVTIPVAGATAYLYVAENDWLADSFAVEVKPGMTGSCGIMGWEVALDMNIADKFTMNVPVICTVSF